MDEYVTSNHVDPANSKFVIKFDYTLFTGDLEQTDAIANIDTTDGINPEDTNILTDSSWLWHLSRSRRHKYLIKHPLIRAFVWSRWQSMKAFFDWNLRFVLMFISTLSWYIFIMYGGINTRNLEDNIIYIGINETNYCQKEYISDKVDYRFWIPIFLINTFMQVKLKKKLMLL